MPTRDQRGDQYEAHGKSLAHVLLLALASCATDPVADRLPPDPDDLDGDGIPNAADLCPETYDIAPHDEDGDGAGDNCDVCPAIAGPQIDSGEGGIGAFADGIGDDCDPRPGVSGDILSYFDPFVEQKTEWVGEGWGIAADVARAVVTARFESPEALNGDGLWAEIQVVTLIWLSGGYVEVAVDTDGATGALRCAVETDTDGDGRDEIVAEEVGVMAVREQLPSTAKTPIRISAWRFIDRDRHGTLRCFFNGRRLEIPASDAVSAGKFAFASSGAITDLASLIVYTFPINPCVLSAERRCDPSEPP